MLGCLAVLSYLAVLGYLAILGYLETLGYLEALGFPVLLATTSLTWSSVGAAIFSPFHSFIFKELRS